MPPRSGRLIRQGGSMRRLFVLAMIAAACGGRPAEEVFVNWTFGGQPCDAAGVATIQFDLAGVALTPNQYTCQAAGQGLDLGAYLPGDYQLTVTGLDASNAITHQVTQTLQVRRGKSTFDVDVPATEITLHWSFNGQACAAAGVSGVNVSLDNQVLSDDAGNSNLPCAQNGIDGTTVGPLGAGAHSFDLVGLDKGGHAVFALNGFAVTALAGQDVLASANLLPAAPTSASANLTWAFDGKSC